MSNSLQVNTSQAVAGLGTFSYTVPGSTNGVAEVTNISTVADSSGSLNSTFFTFFTALNQHAYYVWYNINSTGVDPAVAGKTGIAVAGATGASANTLATATRAAITSAAGTYVTITGATNHVIITNKSEGATTDAADGSAPTGFAFSVTTPGVTGVPSNVLYNIDVESTLPQNSGLTSAIKLNSSTLVSNGGATANPTPTQPSIGCSARTLANAGDVLSIVLSSSAAADNLPNGVKSIVTINVINPGS